MALSPELLLSMVLPPGVEADMTMSSDRPSHWWRQHFKTHEPQLSPPCLQLSTSKEIIGGAALTHFDRWMFTHYNLLMHGKEPSGPLVRIACRLKSFATKNAYSMSTNVPASNAAIGESVMAIIYHLNQNQTAIRKLREALIVKPLRKIHDMHVDIIESLKPSARGQGSPSPKFPTRDLIFEKKVSDVSATFQDEYAYRFAFYR